MLVAALSFALMGTLVKLGSAKFSTAELVFYRSFFGLIVIFIVTRYQGLSLKTPVLPQQMLRATLGFISLLMFFYAISRLDLATAMTLNYTSPLFMASFLCLSLHERPRKALIFAIILGFIGVALLLKPSFHADELLAGGLGLLSGATAGYVYVQVIQLSRIGEPDWRTVFYFTLICTLGGAVWMLSAGFQAIELKDLIIILGLGISGTIGQLCMTRAYRMGSPLVVGSLAYVTVILASLFGVLIGDPPISYDRWLAIAVIIIAGIISVFSGTHQLKK